MEYTRTNPYHASIKSRYRLNKPGSGKETYHVVLDLSGSEFTYGVGDSIGVFAPNRPDVVQATLDALGATGEEPVAWKKEPEPQPLREVFSSRANLARVSKSLLQKVAERQSHPEKRARLERLLEKENKAELSAYMEQHELWDFLKEHSEVKLSVEELVATLSPLLPRFYSIASSQAVVGEEVHFTVAWLNYETSGIQRYGVATDFLCKGCAVGGQRISIYLQATKDFLLPEDDCPIIMVGPGTGIAPYVAFLQERKARGASGANWLFFGEWNREYDYYYEDYFTQLESEGFLRIDTAFSRDQDHKIYVQDRLREHGAEVWEQLNSGAYFYVCGDAERMAKDVDAVLHEIAQTHGGLSEEEAKAFVKGLRKEKRYVRDVY